MEDKKRVKKVTIKDLKKEVAELHNALGEAQESLLNQATKIGRLQDNNVVISNILSGEREVIGKLQADRSTAHSLLRDARNEIERLSSLVHSYEESIALHNQVERERRSTKTAPSVDACAEEVAPRILEPLEEVNQVLLEIRAIREELTRATAVNTNGCVEAGPPRIPAPVFRITTNGKRYSVQKSINGGDTWFPIQEVIRRSTTVCTKKLLCWTYRGARDYIIKQYGEKAKILPREWRQV